MRWEADWTLDWQKSVWKTERDIWLENSHYDTKWYVPYVDRKWIISLMKFHMEVPLTHFGAREHLEKALAEYIGCKYTVAVNSGTTAMLMALRAGDFEVGSEIIGPNYGHPAWVNCCTFLGLKPVPVDIREETLCMNPELIEERVTDRTKAIMFINHGGYVGEDLLKIRSFCSNHQIPLIEDSCSSLGQRHMTKHAGTFGEVGTISFSQPKVVYCGEGGAIITNDDRFYTKMKEMQYQAGWYSTVNREFLHIGCNFNLAPQNAFYVLQQLNDIDSILSKREAIKQAYLNHGLPLHTYETDEPTGHSIYVLKTDKAEEICRRLEQNGIQSLFRVYRPLHKRIPFKGEFPVSEEMVNKVIALPFSSTLTSDEIEKISTIVKKVLDN